MTSPTRTIMRHSQGLRCRTTVNHLRKVMSTSSAYTVYSLRAAATGQKGASTMTPQPDDPRAGDTATRDGKITREVVMAAALELIDRDGADSLSMRRLAAALDR